MPVSLFSSKASVCFCFCASGRLIAMSSFITSPHGLFSSLRPLLSCIALLIVCACATAFCTSYSIVLCLLLYFCDPLMLCAPHPLYGNPCCFTLAKFCSGPGLVCSSRACVEQAYGASGTFRHTLCRTSYFLSWLVLAPTVLFLVLWPGVLLFAAALFWVADAPRPLYTVSCVAFTVRRIGCVWLLRSVSVAVIVCKFRTRPISTLSLERCVISMCPIAVHMRHCIPLVSVRSVKAL